MIQYYNNLITTALKDNNKLQVSIGKILQANAEINKLIMAGYLQQRLVMFLSHKHSM
ncbi:MAG: hypothetical protein AB8V03_05965 [Francisella endosymbiont of Hyalomma asiaticum]